MPTSPSSDYNASIIEEFRVNGGHVGGSWETTPLLLLHHPVRSRGSGESTRWHTCPTSRAT
jgi:hypothetical protein